MNWITFNKTNEVIDKDAFRVLDLESHEEIIKIRSNVMRNLPDANLCLPEKDEHTFIYDNLCNSSGVIIGFFDQPKLAAIGIISFTSPDHPIIEKRLKSNNIKYNKLALLNGSQVLEEYRGNGLQHELIMKRMELAIQHEFDIICAIASPNDHVSKKNLLRNGMKEVDTLKFHPNVERIVYMKNVSAGK